MRCFIDPADWTRELVELSPDESRHAARVLRVREGSEIEILNGRGGVGKASVVSAGKRLVTVRIAERQTVAAPRPRITLVQAVVREQKMDWIVQKAAELGVSEIRPVTTVNAVVQLDADRAGGKAERWTRIALEAIKQSGNPWLPVVAAPCRLDEYLATRAAGEPLLVGSLARGARPLREILRELSARAPESVAVLIGPEGDFTPAELDAALGRGGLPAGFGPTVLRAETAAVFALSALRCEFG